MKRLLVPLAVLLLMLIPSSALPYDSSERITLGKDSDGMTWYVMQCGSDSGGTLYAVARKYYTNASIKTETINELVSSYGIDRYAAETLYFTEYRYEFKEDGSQYAVTHLHHEDMLGNMIYSEDYDDSTASRAKTFVKLIPGSMQEKCYRAAGGTGSPDTAKDGDDKSDGSGDGGTDSTEGDSGDGDSDDDDSGCNTGIGTLALGTAFIVFRRKRS